MGHKKSWEVRRKINILQDSNLRCIWHMRNRDCDVILSLAILSYNFCVMFNILNKCSYRKVADAYRFLRQPRQTIKRIYINTQSKFDKMEKSRL